MIQLTNDRAAALDAGWTILMDRLAAHGIGREQFEAAVSDHDVKAIQDGEAVIGMFMANGPEVHVAVLPAYRCRWFSRRLLRDALSPIVEQFGYVKTSVMPDNTAGMRFVQRLGFERNGNEWRFA